MNSPKLVEFQGGTFLLSDTGNPVEVRAFAMAIYLVTRGQYKELYPDHPSSQYSNQDDQPVTNVSWDDAVRYCKWLSEKTGENYRLPTEAEWEFAASGGGQREYPWGNEEPSPERVNYDISKIGKTTPVGSYPLGATPEGLFDMAGNVWEWCEDWYDDDQIGRVVRGGSFIHDVRDGLRCAARDWDYPDARYDFRGFRVVRGISSGSSEPQASRKIRTIGYSSPHKFEAVCNDLIADGYKLLSTGVAPEGDYQAIFAKPEALAIAQIEE